MYPACCEKIRYKSQGTRGFHHLEFAIDILRI
jgi:hypothetical protein